jgi:hypothetical protein
MTTDFLPVVRDRQPAALYAPVNAHDILQARLAAVLKEKPIAVLQWLGEHIDGIHQRLDLHGDLLALAGLVQRAADLDLQSVLAGGFEREVARLADLWQMDTRRHLLNRAARLRSFALDVAVEVPLTPTMNTLEAPLSVIHPPVGYIDVVVDLDSPFLRILNHSILWHVDIAQMEFPVGKMPFHPRFISHDRPDGYVLALDNLYLPVGMVAAQDHAAAFAGFVAERLADQEVVQAIREKIAAIIARRAHFAGPHEFLALEIKTGTPPVESLWEQVGKYERRPGINHHLSSEPLSGNLSPFFSAEAEHQLAGLPDGGAFVPGRRASRSLWDVGPLVQCTPNSRIGDAEVHAEYCPNALWTTHAVLLKDRYAEREAARQAGLNVIDAAGEVLAEIERSV